MTHPDDLDSADAHALDPDWSDVPPEVAKLDGTEVTMTGADGSTTASTLVIVPGLWGHARRYRDQPDGVA